MIKAFLSVLCAVFFIAGASYAQAPASAVKPAAANEEASRDITARFGAVNTIQSRFVQEKRLSMLKEPVVSEGFFIFQKPSDIRWEYEKPFQSGFLISNGKTYRLEDGRKTLQKNPMAAGVAAQLLAWLTFDLHALSKQYAVSFFEGGVTLVPSGNSPVVKITAWFSAENPQALSRVQMDERGGDQTVLTFLNPLINQPLLPEAFE